MSTSDSDYSIDWLASDEDDCESLRRLSPQRAEETPVPLPSSSSSKESSTSCFHFNLTQRRRIDRCDSPTAVQMLALSPVQGFTSVCTQHMLPVASQHWSTRKRAHVAGLDGLCEKPQPDSENELFSHKCTELQCYIQPLASILQGLRSGRYSQRLSSFQESVAMDRIQRILGVLQNPNMGGRFLAIIMKIEEMLQSWFPHIKPDPPAMDDRTPAKKQKHHHSSASPPPSSPAPLRPSDVEPSGSHTSTHLKWLHTSPICSLKTLEPTVLAQPATTTAAASPLPVLCGQGITQDNAVSSSTDSRSGEGPTRRLATANPRLSRAQLTFKISSPCLERLLQAKDSIVSPRTVGDGGWLS